MGDPQETRLMERVVNSLRVSGQAPSLSAQVVKGEGDLPRALQSDPPPPRRQVGRRMLSANDRGRGLDA